MPRDPSPAEESVQTGYEDSARASNGNFNLDGDVIASSLNLPLYKGPGACGEDASLEHTRSTASASAAAAGLSLPREILFVGIICLAQFTAQLGLGQTLFILPVIGRSFDISDPGQLSWLIAGYSLTVGTFIIISGRLGDMFGYKRMLLVGFSWYALWSMVAGLSVYSGHVLFVFARVFQGIGPAITLPNGVALLGSTYPPGPRKAMVFALFGACAPGTLCAESVHPPRRWD